MLKRYLIELGMGIDQHGQDPTKAAQKAIKDAVSRAYLVGIGEALGIKDFNQIIVKAKVAVPGADKVDPERVLAAIPFGGKEVEIVEGGLVAEGSVSKALGDKTPDILVANAAVTVWVDI